MRIGVCGCTGKTGALVVEYIKQRGHEFAYGVSSKSGDIDGLCANSDVVIDFSLPEVTESLLQHKFHVPLVIGTTGLRDTHIKLMNKAAETTAVFYSANMSVSIAVINMMLEKFVDTLRDYDVDILDVHHKRKKDAPSGTALMLGDTIRAHGSNVHFESQRCGNIVGIHEISFTSDNDRLTIKHETYRKDVFAQNAVKIAEWISTQPPGLYSMREYLASCSNC